MPSFAKQGSAMLSSFLSLVGAGDQDLASSEFAGTWTVEDSAGQPFEIALFGSGTAEANRAGEGMSGTWTEEGTSAAIVWDTGWTTKITRMGDHYIKTAYAPSAATPTNSSVAIKDA